MLVLRESDLRKLLPMRDVIDAVEAGFRALARGDVTVPARLHMNVPGGVFLQMPAYAAVSTRHDGAGAEQLAGIKIVSVFDENYEKHLDAVQATYLLLDGGTGVPLSLMDGKFLTAIRTAATSAVATRLMARPGPVRLGLFGAGVQAYFHLQAMLEVTRITDVMIASRSGKNAQRLAGRITSEHGIEAAVRSHQDVAAEADLICTCTTCPEPLFPGALLKEGSHVNAVGAFTPATREIDSTAVLRSRVIIDADEAAGTEAGDILIPISEGVINRTHIVGTLAELVTGRIRPRSDDREITLFKSCGLAIEDLVVAGLAHSRARDSGIGTRIEG